MRIDSEEKSKSSSKVNIQRERAAAAPDINKEINLDLTKKESFRAMESKTVEARFVCVRFDRQSLITGRK